MHAKIIYEDQEIILVNKPANLAVQTSKIGEMDLESEMRNHLASEGIVQPYLAIINRLDQPVEGIVLLAKSEHAAKELSRQMVDGNIGKEYIALVYGQPPTEEGTCNNYLMKEPRGNRSRVVIPEQLTSLQRKFAKRAILSYQQISTQKDEFGVFSTIRVHLVTGRHHQIRVQLSHEGMPILGDAKYGTKESAALSLHWGHHTIALCADRITFEHPHTKKPMEFHISPTFWDNDRKIT